jgi:hypothetical protein
MKSKGLLFLVCVVLIQTAGCIAIPPLINVHESSDGSSKSRIDSLERRIERLEKAADEKNKI